MDDALGKSTRLTSLEKCQKKCRLFGCHDLSVPLQFFLRSSKKAHAENPDALTALNAIQSSFRLLLNESKLNINLQESYLRMHANSPPDDLQLPDLAHISEFQELSARAIALRKVLSRIPDEMADRRLFLDTIKEIASSIKKLLDTTNGIITMLPSNSHRQFSNTLKEYFKTRTLTRAIREKVRLQ
uniref:Uncharacterized protein n=1 Tax=Ditylenchus dipsaci TaxID=166011 RepID=A0A915ELZ8_9BILA